MPDGNPTPPPTRRPDPAVKARAVHQRRAAVRALDDPRKVRWATRIVQAALERNVLTLADLACNQEGGTDAVAS